MHARGGELIAQVRTSRAGAVGVVGPEHDVVGEQLRAPVEELGERLLAVLGIEAVLLLDGNPRELTALFGHLLAELGVLGLELGQLIASGLPFLARCDLVVGHRRLPWPLVTWVYALRPACDAELIARQAILLGWRVPVATTVRQVGAAWLHDLGSGNRVRTRRIPRRFSSGDGHKHQRP